MYSSEQASGKSGMRGAIGREKANRPKVTKEKLKIISYKKNIKKMAKQKTIDEIEALKEEFFNKLEVLGIPADSISHVTTFYNKHNSTYEARVFLVQKFGFADFITLTTSRFVTTIKMPQIVSTDFESVSEQILEFLGKYETSVREELKLFEAALNNE